MPALTEALADEDPETVAEVLFALAKIGPDAKTAVAAVAEKLADEEPRVALAACFALGKIGPDAVEAKAALIENLASENDFLPESSAWALSQICPECAETAPKTVPLLAKALDDPQPTVRLGAIEALGALGPLAKNATEPLKKLAEGGDDLVAPAAAEALKKIGG